MTSSPLNLLFPQWQGSGPVNALYHAAMALAKHCPQTRFTPVPVPEIETLEVSCGILGYDSILSQMTDAAKIVKQAAPTFILTIGGDCGIEPVPVSYLNRLHNGNFTLVWLDAHADLNTPETSPSGDFHGMPLATLMGMGDTAICNTCFSTLRPDQVILAGVRAMDPAEARFIDDQGINRVSVSEMEADRSALTRAIRKKGNHPVYIHIDLDVLDPGFYPYIRHPEPGGIMADTLAGILDDIKTDCTVAGLGLMEFTLEPFTKISVNTEPDTRGLEIVLSLMEKYRDYFVSGR